jgi:type I restriction enzyme, S subunit
VKQGWQTRKLGETCSYLNRGISPKYIDSGGICVLNQRCVRDHRISYEHSRRHDTLAKSVDDARYIRIGDVLVNSTGTGTLGRVAQARGDIPEPTTVDSHVTIIRPDKARFDPAFFGYMIVAIEHQIAEAGEGCGGQTELARSALAQNFDVTFPESIAEQRRIVGILDGAFAAIATAKANTEKNLQNARTLFEGCLRAAFTHTNGTPRLPIGEVATVFDGPHATPRTVESGPIFLGISSLQDGLVNLQETRHVTSDDFQKWTRRVKPQAGDVVFSYETRLGQAAIIPAALECCLGRRMGLVRTDRRKLDPRFFTYQYISPQFREFLNQRTLRGATVDRISIREFPGFPITVPDLGEQQRTVERLDAARRDTAKLDSHYRERLAGLEELKKSLLDEAFHGRL